MSIADRFSNRWKRFIWAILKDNSSHALYDDRGYIRP